MTFKSGTSGNLNDRPKGTGHRQNLFNTTVAPHQEALIEKAINLALSGNEVMLRLFVDRLLPTKSHNVPLILDFAEYGDLNKYSDIVSIGKKIIENVVTNNITPEEAKALMCILEGHSKNIKVANLQWGIPEFENIFK